MIKTLPKEVVREMELELAQEVELELRIQEAWWTLPGIKSGNHETGGLAARVPGKDWPFRLGRLDAGITEHPA